MYYFLILHCDTKQSQGHVAERRGKGLQNLTRRFESVPDLFSYGKQSLKRGGVSTPLFFPLLNTSFKILII